MSDLQKSTENQPAAGKQVLIFNTNGANKTITTNATTWGELESQLNRDGITTSGMKAVIGETKLSMDSAQSVLPTENFRVFLLPQKTKSGSSVFAC